MTMSPSRSRHLRGHVALARGDAMDAREMFIGRRSAVAHRPAARGAAVGGGRVRVALAPARSKPMLDDARAACAALPADDEGIEACTAQLALGHGTRAAAGQATRARARCARRSRCPATGQLLRGPAARSWRWARRGAALPARSAHRTRVAQRGAHRGARSRSRGRPRAVLHHARARRGHDRSLARGSGASYHEAAELAHDTGQPGDECAALAGLAWLEAREGREESCRAHARRSARTGARVRSRHSTRPGRSPPWAISSSRSAGRGGDRSADRHDHALERLGIADVDLSPAPELAEALVQCGRSEDGGHGGERPIASARRREGPAVGTRTRGSRRRASSPAMRRSRSLLRRGAALARLHARHVRAGAQRAGLRRAPPPRAPPERRAARTCATAFAAFHQLGAEPWAERARLELAATGETTRKRDPSTLDQLTPRELQVALDLASGLTTREAASKLYLSPKTIEFHLRSVYRKLGIASRAELATALSRPDLD